MTPSVSTTQPPTFRDTPQASHAKPTPSRPPRPPPPSTRIRHGQNALVTIVLPAKDEAAAIGKTLDALPVSTLHAQGFQVEVLVLDGCSQDNTAEIARNWGATVIEDRGRGKGTALREARSRFVGEYVIMLDGDGTYAPDAIPRLLGPLVWGEADIVMGRRRRQAGSMTPLHRVGNALLSLGARTLYVRRCPDLCTGMWAFSNRILQAMPLRCRGFELEAELFAVASRMKLRIRHIFVDYLPRRGHSKLGTADGLRIGWCLLQSRFRSINRLQPPGAATTHSPRVVLREAR